MRVLALTVVVVAAVAVSPAIKAFSPPSKEDVAHYAEQELVANYAKDGPGAAILIARGDEIVFRGARGVGDLGEKTPLSAQSTFEIGSITKQFVAAGLLKLVEFHKASLDGALVSTVDDLLAWNRALHHGRVLKNASYRRLTTPVGPGDRGALRFGTL